VARLRFFGLFRPRPARGSVPSGNTGRHHFISNPHHAVSVNSMLGGCAASWALRGKRFLSSDAPSLPLEGCTASTCSCRYVHHEDRRSAARRTADVMRRSDVFFAGVERRQAGGRRITDH
jgi:hypothetical protein